MFQTRTLPLLVLQFSRLQIIHTFNVLSILFDQFLMMSNSNDETLHNIKQSTPFKIKYLDKNGPSNEPQNTAKHSTPGSDATLVTNTSFTDNSYTNSLFQKFSPAHRWPAWNPKMQIWRKYEIASTRIIKTDADVSAKTYTAKARTYMLKRVCLPRR